MNLASQKNFVELDNLPTEQPKSSTSRAAANKVNAQKSTGAVTAEGKAASSMNAVKHGLLSGKAVLSDEDGDQYQAMLDGLFDSLAPVGLIEELLVERVAVSFWKQRRLLGAETAVIQADQVVAAYRFQSEVRTVGGLSNTTEDYKEALSAEDSDSVTFFNTLRAELDTINYGDTPSQIHAHVSKNCPNLQGALEEEYDFNEPDPDDIREAIAETVVWCNKNIANLSQKQEAVPIIEVVKRARSAPISHELLHRYQVAVDGELYRALAALQRQQEHRFKRLEVVG